MTTKTKPNIKSVAPVEITDHQLETAWFWLSLIKDEESMLELLKMRMDYIIYSRFTRTGEII
ncbi:hypothetical protein NVP1278O_07 [Vibrio phage 1.278.O._10N.286.54.E8]|nr:hypothetical protein NVP1278O_07 [Vibrio phage 1.278.O._10N.286.54.E8]